MGEHTGLCAGKGLLGPEPWGWGSVSARCAAKSGQLQGRQRGSGGEEVQELRRQNVGWAIHALHIPRAAAGVLKRKAEAGTQVRSHPGGQ